MDCDTRAVVDALDAAREQSGLTNAEFARAVGTSPSRYSMYRTGKVAPAATFLVRALRIAKALAAADREEILDLRDPRPCGSPLGGLGRGVASAVAPDP